MALSGNNTLWNALVYASRGAYIPVPDGGVNRADRALMLKQYSLFLESDDIVDNLLDLLIEQFTESDRLHSYLRVFLVQAQEALNEAFALGQLRALSTATGKQLDGIGEIVGELRAGKADEEYRIALYFRIFLNVSSGEPETLIAALKASSEATDIKYQEIYPATVLLFSNGIPTSVAIARQMQKIAAGGVKVYVTGLYTGVPFTFDGEGGYPSADGLGWNELGYTEDGNEIGGQIVELYV